MYKGQIIHFNGGINAYVGELDQANHKNGENWYRIINPCEVRYKAEPNGLTRMGLSAIWGNGDFFKHFIDIKVPDESIIEIRIVDKEGDLYEAYKKEIKRKKSKIIQVPSNMTIQ